MTEKDKKPAKPESVRVSVASCPMCGRTTQPRYRPFCSNRCADADLGKWFGEGYRVPTDEPADPMVPVQDEDRREDD